MLATSLPVAQWLERPTGVRKVMGSIPVGDSAFSLSHARDMLNIPSFLSLFLFLKLPCFHEESVIDQSVWYTKLQ